MKIFLTILVLFIVFTLIAGKNTITHTAFLQEAKVQQAKSESLKNLIEKSDKAFKIRNEKRQNDLTILQPKLKKLIQSYADHDMFYKIEYSNGIPYLWINDVFSMLTIDKKNFLLTVIYDYYNNQYPEVDRIYLHDAYTGKNVGNFRPSTGIIIY